MASTGENNSRAYYDDSVDLETQGLGRSDPRWKLVHRGDANVAFVHSCDLGRARIAFRRREHLVDCVFRYHSGPPPERWSRRQIAAMYRLDMFTLASDRYKRFARFHRATSDFYAQVSHESLQCRVMYRSHRRCYIIGRNLCIHEWKVLEFARRMLDVVFPRRDVSEEEEARRREYTRPLLHSSPVSGIFATVSDDEEEYYADRRGSYEALRQDSDRFETQRRSDRADTPLLSLLDDEARRPQRTNE